MVLFELKWIKYFKNKLFWLSKADQIGYFKFNTHLLLNTGLEDSQYINPLKYLGLKKKKICKYLSKIELQTHTIRAQSEHVFTYFEKYTYIMYKTISKYRSNMNLLLWRQVCIIHIREQISAGSHICQPTK